MEFNEITEHQAKAEAYSSSLSYLKDVGLVIIDEEHGKDEDIQWFEVLIKHHTDEANKLKGEIFKKHSQKG